MSTDPNLNSTRQQQVLAAKEALLGMDQEIESLKKETELLREQLHLQKLESQTHQANSIRAMEERDIMMGERDEAVAQRYQMETFFQLLRTQVEAFVPPAAMKRLPGDVGAEAVQKAITHQKNGSPPVHS